MIFLLLVVAMLMPAVRQSAATADDPFKMEKWEMFKRGSTEGRLVYIRGNVALRSLPDRSRYPYRVGFIVAIRKPNSFGLPETDEARDLAPVENEIDRAMTRPRLAFLALVITTGGLREFVFYAHDQDAVRKKIASMGRSVLGRDIRTYVVADPGWEIYSRFTQ